MVEQKENFGDRIMEAVLAVIFILFALSYLNGRVNNSLNQAENNISKELVLSQENAVVNTEFQIIPADHHGFSKIRFPEVNSIRILIAENRKYVLSVLLQINETSQKPIFSPFVCYRHIFPPEKDEIPLVS